MKESSKQRGGQGVFGFRRWKNRRYFPLLGIFLSRKLR